MRPGAISNPDALVPDCFRAPQMVAAPLVVQTRQVKASRSRQCACKGAGFGLQSRAYLPEAHTDFVLAGIGEEYGLVATSLVALTYLVIFALGYRALRHSADLFRLNVGLGALLFLVIQALVNMGVVTGLLPTKGISLPFLSYGGTNLVVMACMVGLVLNCIREASRPVFTPREARA